MGTMLVHTFFFVKRVTDMMLKVVELDGPEPQLAFPAQFVL